MSTPRKTWRETMTPDEILWVEGQILARVEAKLPEDPNYSMWDNERAARIWVSSQRRRFLKDRADGCCGSEEWLAERDGKVYMLGFNYGH